MYDRITILGVPIDPVTQDQAVDRIRRLLMDGGQYHVMTPNPEMLVNACSDEYFRGVLNRTSLNVPDGIGLLWAARFLGNRLPARVTGVDLVDRLCALHDLGPVFFLGAAPGVAERAVNILRHRFPHLQIAGTFAGSPHVAEEQMIIDRINASGARVLFVAFGSPVQDLWIDWVLKRLTTVRVAMGVGGAFDFIAGAQSRAPAWMRTIGIEWLWRLIKEPWRLRRIWRAVVVFPCLVLRERPLSDYAASRT